MDVRKAVLAIWAACVVAVTSPFAQADETPLTAEQANALLKRLEQAEARISKLQTELQSVRSQQTAPQLPTGLRVKTSSDGSSPGRTGATDRNVSYHDDSDLMKRLETLEGNWVKMSESNSKIQDQLDDYFVKDGGSRSTMAVTGRIHGDYWAFPDTDNESALREGGDPPDRFVWRRIRFGVKGDIKDNMTYKIEMEFANPNSTEYRDVYIGFKDLPFLHTLLIGNQKRPYGLDHLNSSRYNVFMERPFIIESFNEDARRLGIASYGVSDDQAWNWRLGVYNSEKTQNDAGYLGDNYQLEVAGRIANTAWYDECTDGRSYFHWAVSGTSAHPDGDGQFGSNNLARFRTRPEARTSQRWLNTGRIAGAEHYHLLGSEAVLNLGPLQVVGEYQNLWLKRNNASSLMLHGGYVYASYFLTGEHMPWDRKSGTLARPKPFQNFFLVNTCDDCVDGGWGAWQVALRWSYADLSDENIIGGVGESLTLGVNWYWNANSRLQFNYINGKIEDAPGDTDYDIIGARFMVDF